MENISKALMMAGGIMISILILSLIVFGVTRWSKYQRAQEQATRDEQIIEYNKQFDAYNKQIVTGFEMVSLANLINDVNKRYDAADGFKSVTAEVKVISGGCLGATSIGSNNYRLETINYNGASEDTKKAFKKRYFKCTKVEHYDETDGKANAGRIHKMTFKEIERKN